MIVLNLSCEHEHLFEGWFASADAYEAQRAQTRVACPMCESTAITRRPTAAYVNTTTSRSRASELPRKEGEIARAVVARAVSTLRTLARSAEDVGKCFPEEARRMHEGDAPARAIRGEASARVVDDLLDEGILVLPVPPDTGALQ